MGMAVGGVDLLSEKAAMMRESLQKSQTITDNVVTILGSFDHRLSALETAMRPTQVTHTSQSAPPHKFFYSQNGVFGFGFCLDWLVFDLVAMGFWVLPYGVGGIWSEFCGFMALVLFFGCWMLDLFIWACRLELILLGKPMRTLTRLWRLQRLYCLTLINIARLVFVVTMVLLASIADFILCYMIQPPWSVSHKTAFLFTYIKLVRVDKLKAQNQFICPVSFTKGYTALLIYL